MELGIQWHMVQWAECAEEHRVFALHFESTKDDYKVIKEILEELYRTKVKKFPLSIKLRFVPDLFTIIRIKAKAKAM